MSILERHVRLPERESLKRDLHSRINQLLRIAPPIPVGNEVIKSKRLYLPQDVVGGWRDRPRIGANDRMPPDEFIAALRSLSFRRPGYALEYDTPQFAAVLVPEVTDKNLRKETSISLNLSPHGISETWLYELVLDDVPALTYYGEAYAGFPREATRIQGDTRNASDKDLAAFSKFLSVATSQH